MSFISSVFVVDSLERFKKFCETVAIEYHIVQEFDGGSAAVSIHSDDQIEPPNSFIWPGSGGQEVEIDFYEELKKLIPKGEKVSLRVEYDVEISEAGDVEFLCDTIIGMPPHEGDADGDPVLHT